MKGSTYDTKLTVDMKVKFGPRADKFFLSILNCVTRRTIEVETSSCDKK